MTALDEANATNDSPHVIEGIVIGLDIGAWAGFESGRIILREGTGSRKEFFYGRNSCGKIPKTGDTIRIEFNGDLHYEIISIAILDVPRKEIFDRVSASSSSLHLIAGRPKSAALIVFTEILVGIGVILIGLFLGASKPAAPAIFGAVGLAQFCIAWLVWQYSGGN